MFNEITSGLLFEKVFVWPTALHSPVDFWEELPLHPLVVVIALSISLWKKIVIVFISPAFSLIKSFSTIHIVLVWWRTCPKGFLLAGFASYSTLCLQYTNEILSFHLAEGSLPSPWYFSLSWDLSARILNCLDFFHMLSYWNFLTEEK